MFAHVLLDWYIFTFQLFEVSANRRFKLVELETWMEESIMNDIELIQFYKDMYFKELERKEKITAHAHIRFGFVATALTLIAYMLKPLDINNLGLASGLLLAFIAMSLIPLAYSVVVLTKAFWGNTYLYLPSPKDIEQYRTDLTKYNTETEEDRSQINAASIVSFESYLIDELCEVSSHNIKVNETRLSKMNRFYIATLISLPSFVIAGCIFIVADLDSTEVKYPSSAGQFEMCQ